MKFQPRTIRLVGEAQRDMAMSLIRNLPARIQKPLEIVIREEKPVRKLSQNDLMWAGPLADLAGQAWVNGRQFSAEVWHEFLKRENLPEDDDPDLSELVKDGYRKWDYTPDGERVVVGSTTQLTVKGFSEYLEKLFAYGASLGVHFTEAKR